jgi:lycopene beta-cyclase
MQAASEYDLLILGGGCAGLSLALRLAESDYAGRVGIVEPRREYDDDRSWCFWAPDAHPLTGLVSCRWHRWQLSQRHGALTTRAAAGASYQYVNSLDFYDRALDSIHASRHIELLQGEAAERVYRLNGHLMVDTAKATLRSRWIVDTRPPASEPLAQSTLFQCFHGRVVSLAENSPAAFDPDAVELMTDMQTDPHGFRFSYVLPFDRRRALVEVTRFSRHPIARAQLDEELLELLHRRQWRPASFEREEAAVLPMGLPSASPEPMPGHVRAGTGGGALRAASGYGFLRIQRWATQCCASLVQDGPPLPQPAEPARQAWMDRLFLRVLRDQPEQAPRLFERMFQRVPGPALLRFLGDQASALDCLRLVTALPARPFLKSLVQIQRRDGSQLT